MKKNFTTLGVISLILLSGCLKQPSSPKITEKKIQIQAEMQGTKNCDNFECGTSSIQDLQECDLSEYDMQCNLVKLLEENLAWTIDEDGIDFCTYQVLAEEKESLYLQVFCSEYYIQNQEVRCPDSLSLNECFVSKSDSLEICEEKCEINNVKPYLATGGGLSGPVKITKATDGSYSIWKPRDGNLYQKDLKANFPSEVYEKLENINIEFLQDTNILRAEEYFQLKARFKTSGELNQKCQKTSQCGQLPVEYAIRSNCPHTVKCLENQCVAGCYDFIDHYNLPLLKQYTWQDAVNLIQKGEVEQAFQSHALDVQLFLKNGVKIDVIEPRIDMVFDEIEKCGEVCKDIVKITE